MITGRDRWHRWGLAAILLGNAVGFAGVDPPARALTALLILALVLDMKDAVPSLPRPVRLAALGLAATVVLQLVPLPAAVRGLLQPGLADVISPGWSPLSVAPWATIETAAIWVLAAGITLVAARMARTRSGLPVLLWIVALTGGLLALLGLVSEAGLPDRVLLLRPNVQGGSPYGPFVNENHFAVAMELTIPAAAALLAVAARGLGAVGEARRRALAWTLGAAVLVVLGLAALLRCHSRGGILAMGIAAVVTFPLWRRRRPGRRRLWTAVVVLILVGGTVLAWTRLPALAEDFKQLLVIRGVEGNDRWDLWRSTLRLWTRAPALGTGLGTYRHVIGLDAPPTGTAVLEQAHNDWLEWLATTGAAGTAALLLGVGWLAWSLRPVRLRSMRFERRYALAAAAMALLAAGLHETLGFALQTPLDRYLAAVWIGLVAGLETRRHHEPPDGRLPEEADR